MNRLHEIKAILTAEPEYPMTRRQKFLTYGTALAMEVLAVDEMVRGEVTAGLALSATGVAVASCPTLGWSEFGAPAMRPDLINQRDSETGQQG